MGAGGTAMSEMTAKTAPARLEGSVKISHKIWPTAVVVVGLGLTVAWTIVLGYGLVKMIAAAI